MRIDVPVEIGQTLWLANKKIERDSRPCSICLGHKTVTVSNRVGECYRVACAGCYVEGQGALGIEHYEVYVPKAIPFEVEAVTEIFVAGKTQVVEFKAVDGRIGCPTDMFLTEQAAFVESQRYMDQVGAIRRDLAALCKTDKLRSTVGNLRWHKQAIAKAGETIRWHQEQLGMVESEPEQ